MTKQRYAWVPSEAGDEMMLIVDGKRAGALILWEDNEDRSQGWTCVVVTEDGDDRELMTPDAFWTPLEKAQRFLLDAVGLASVDERASETPPAQVANRLEPGREVALTCSIAAMLRRERGKSGMSQQDLARAVGVRTDSVKDWEAALRQPRLAQLLDVLSALGALPRAMHEILAENAKNWGGVA